MIRNTLLAVVVSVILAAAMPAAGAQSNSTQSNVIDPTELAEQGLVRLDDVEAATLLFATDQPGWYVPAPALHTDIDVTVSGPVARGIVSQRFRNVAEVFVEGKYVFPLPEGAAIDTLRMRVGDRWVEGTLEERGEARLIYETAKDAGQVTSLVEQERPNVFTTSVANIAPGADVIVQIHYQQTLAPRDGLFGLRVPLVVAPRYAPAGDRSVLLALGPAGWETSPLLDADAARVATTVVDPRTEPPGTVRNPVDISIDLDAGFPLGHVDSPYHDIDVDRRSANTASISLDRAVPANRDFYLSWRPIELDQPYATVFTEQPQGDRHYVTMLTPPAPAAIEAVDQPREVIFVQDTSGSMGGESLAQAKIGLLTALDRLGPEDTFMIIEFNSVFTMFERRPVPANERNIARAKRWVADLVATGGTEMLPALRTALRAGDSADTRLRQVIFLTDGAVTNELEMLTLIERELGQSRLFTVGIGSAPNSYFMTAAARSGRGSFVFIGDLEEVDDRMSALFAKIENPALVDLHFEDLPVGVAVSPSPIPDLYTGDPIVVTVRIPAGVDMQTMRLVGTRGTEGWSSDIDLIGADIRPGVAKLWAREHIRDLENLRVSPLLTGDHRRQIDDDILATALEFGLVSRLTSLVAVDLEVTRPAGADGASTEIATNLPHGWDPDIFFGDPSSGDDAAMGGELVERLIAADAIRVAQSQAGPGAPFAATGADWQLQAAAGMMLIGFGCAAWLLNTRRRRDRQT